MPIMENIAIKPRIKANRRVVEISTPKGAVADVFVAVAAVVAVAGVADIFYQRQGYIPR